jgi:hypothetical protein
MSADPIRAFRNSPYLNLSFEWEWRGKMRNSFCFAVLLATLCANTTIAQSQDFTIGPAANPAAKIRAEEKAAAEKRLKKKEKSEACRKQAVTEKIAPRERKSFIFSCEKK